MHHVTTHMRHYRQRLKNVRLRVLRVYPSGGLLTWLHPWPAGAFIASTSSTSYQLLSSDSPLEPIVSESRPPRKRRTRRLDLTPNAQDASDTCVPKSKAGRQVKSLPPTGESNDSNEVHSMNIHVFYRWVACTSTSKPTRDRDIGKSSQVSPLYFAHASWTFLRGQCPGNIP